MDNFTYKNTETFIQKLLDTDQNNLEVIKLYTLLIKEKNDYDKKLLEEQSKVIQNNQNNFLQYCLSCQSF